MRRLSSTILRLAIACLIVGILAWPLTLRVAVPAFVVAAAALVVAMFAGVRVDHLREIDGHTDRQTSASPLRHPLTKPDH